MRRPNLARERFENVRPVWAVGAVLALAAGVLSSVTAVELLGARGVEQGQIARLDELRSKRVTLQREVATIDRELAAVGWRRLRSETEALQEVVAGRQFSWSRMLGDLERVMPWDVRLISVAPSMEKGSSLRLQLRVVAVSRPAWLSLLARVFADSAFSEPVPEAEESAASSGGQGHLADLSVRYWPGGRP